MIKKIRIVIIIIPLFLIWSGCKENISGNLVENKAPATQLAYESINREGEFRLSSQVRISWYGTDPDGYVIGYEFAINDTSETAWTFTTKTDSLFILPITEGQSNDDVLFKVRSVDNDSLRDPIGASLKFPIVNSDPTTNLTEVPPDTLYSISSFAWSINDPDGFLNLRSTEIAVNDTANGWISIPFSDEQENGESIFLSLILDNKVAGSQNADLFLGKALTQLDGVEKPTVQVGSKNTFYVRVTDKAGAVSEIDSVLWFVKQQKSKVLLLNDNSNDSDFSSQAFHLERLESQGITPDVWIINDGGSIPDFKTPLSKAFPKTIDPTLTNTLKNWDHIYWISDDINRNITYAQQIADEFFDNGGTMFVNIPVRNILQSDPLFNFLPIDSLGQLTGTQTGFVVNASSSVTTLLPNYPNLTTTRRAAGIIPLKPTSESQALYNTEISVRTADMGTQPYNGYQTIAIKNAENNLVIFGFDLETLSNESKLNTLIQKICIEELGFKQ